MRSTIKIVSLFLLLLFIGCIEESPVADPTREQEEEETFHTVSVINGNGAGTFFPGVTVTISASPTLDGNDFLQWTGADLLILEDSTSAVTTFEMPDSNITFTAVYEEKQRFKVIVENGYGDGEFLEQELVAITAQERGEYFPFRAWSGPSAPLLIDTLSKHTQFIMPDSSVSFTANYDNICSINGVILKSDSLYANQPVPLTIDDYGVFDYYTWDIMYGSDVVISDTTTAKSHFFIPEHSGLYVIDVAALDTSGVMHQGLRVAFNILPLGTSDSTSNGDSTGVGNPLDGDGVSSYPLHSNITAGLFWIGKGASDASNNVSNVGSAWRGDWGETYGVEDWPDMARDADGFPLDSRYRNLENPYYIALPYSDLGALISDVDGETISDTSATVYGDSWSRKKSSLTAVYWKDEESWSPYNESMCKNRWLKISANGKTCYAQWEEAGPFFYNDTGYVFGAERPLNEAHESGYSNPGAGIEMSPAVMHYLTGSASMGKTTVSWQFIDEESVPNGPWGKVITTSQVGGW